MSADKEKKLNKTCIFVLGMHRSGTSALSGSLAVLGVPQSSNLVEAVEGDNPKGYWEPKEVVAINDDIFDAFNMHYMDHHSFPDNWLNNESMASIRHRIKSWFTRAFGNDSLLSIKDPRLCRTLPLWLDVLEDMEVESKFIHIFRHPMDVVKSLQVRDASFSTVDGLLAWSCHVLDAINYAPAESSVIVSYEVLMDNPRKSFQIASKLLDVGWLNDSTQAYDDLEMFLDPNLVHHHFHGEVPYAPLNQLVKKLLHSIKENDLRRVDNSLKRCVQSYMLDHSEFVGLIEEGSKKYLLALNAEKKNAIDQVGYRDLLIAELQEQNTSLQEQYTSLQEQNTSLQEQYTSLQEQMKSKKVLLRLFLQALFNRGDKK